MYHNGAFTGGRQGASADQLSRSAQRTAQTTERVRSSHSDTDPAKQHPTTSVASNDQYDLILARTNAGAIPVERPHAHEQRLASDHHHATLAQRATSREHSTSTPPPPVPTRLALPPPLPPGPLELLLPSRRRDTTQPALAGRAHSHLTMASALSERQKDELCAGRSPHLTPQAAHAAHPTQAQVDPRLPQHEWLPRDVRDAQGRDEPA